MSSALKDNVTDREGQFTLYVWKAFYQQLSINETPLSQYHVQTDVQGECLNPEILLDVSEEVQQKQRASLPLPISLQVSPHSSVLWGINPKPTWSGGPSVSE